MARGLTISCAVHNDKPGIDIDSFSPMLERHCVGMTSKSVLGFEEVDLMVCTFEGPYCCNARAATANNGNFLCVLHCKNVNACRKTKAMVYAVYKTVSRKVFGT